MADDVEVLGAADSSHRPAGSPPPSGRRPLGLAAVGLVIGLAAGAVLASPGTDRAPSSNPAPVSSRPPPSPAPPPAPPAPAPADPVGDEASTSAGPPSLGPGPGAERLPGPLAVAAGGEGWAVVWVLGPDGLRSTAAVPAVRSPALGWLGDGPVASLDGVSALAPDLRDPWSPVLDGAGLAPLATDRVVARTADGWLSLQDGTPPVRLPVPELGRPLAAVTDGLVWLAPAGRGPGGFGAAVFRVAHDGDLAPLGALAPYVEAVVGQGPLAFAVEPRLGTAGDLVAVDVAADRLVARVPLPGSRVAALCPAPGGQAVAVVDVDGRGSVVDVATGAEVARFDAVAGGPTLGWVDDRHLVHRAASDAAGTELRLLSLDAPSRVEVVAVLGGGSSSWVVSSPATTCP